MICRMPARRPPANLPVHPAVKLLKKWRTDPVRNLSQAEAAEYIGCSVHVIRSWERGGSSPNEITAALLQFFVKHAK